MSKLAISINKNQQKCCNAILFVTSQEPHLILPGCQAQPCLLSQDFHEEQGILGFLVSSVDCPLYASVRAKYLNRGSSDSREPYVAFHKYTGGYASCNPVLHVGSQHSLLFRLAACSKTVQLGNDLWTTLLRVQFAHLLNLLTSVLTLSHPR